MTVDSGSADRPFEAPDDVRAASGSSPRALALVLFATLLIEVPRRESSEISASVGDRWLRFKQYCQSFRTRTLKRNSVDVSCDIEQERERGSGTVGMN